MKSTILISGKNKKKYFNMSSENLTQSATRLIIQNDVECEIVLVF